MLRISQHSLALHLLLSISLWGQSQKGTVSGTVFDAQTSRPIVGAKVFVDGQTGDGLTTGTDGTYRIELSPGKYSLKFTSDNYLDVTLTDVNIKAGESVDGSTILTSKGMTTTVEVSESISAVTATAEAMLSERKLAAQVSDSISNEEMKKSTASDAARALEKVTGVSVVEGGYVYVRGLGERYSATMLNNAMVPTTEAERRVVPLDLFPAAMIDNIRILKTYTPDLPGEFSGGLVQMTTVEFPVQKTFQVSMTMGFNDRTTFGRFTSYPGGSLDQFGFDDGTRTLPSAIPTNRRVSIGSDSRQQLADYAKAFSNNWQPVYTDSVRPAQTYSVVGGGTFGRFGIVGALTFTNKPQYQQEQQTYYRRVGVGGTIAPYSDYPDFNQYDQMARLGGVLNAAIKLTNNHKLLFRNTMTRDSDKEAREFSGFDNNQGGIIQSQRLRWVERRLVSTGLEGDHALPKLRDLLVKWQFTYSQSGRDEPDMREVLRSQQEDGRFAFLNIGNSGQRFFDQFTDRIYEPQAEISQPFFKGKLSGIWKVGFRATLRNRDFDARRFRFQLQNPQQVNVYADSNELFGAANLRPGAFELREESRGTDRYTADMKVYGGYGMVDFGIGPRWRFVTGVRIEDADINVVTSDPFLPGTPYVANLANRDPLPSFNAIYALKPRQNLRFTYSQTVSRPDFRELSPFEFTNVQGGFNVAGNPNLRRAKINNYDARWEWFPGGNQLLAASFFVKDFTDPIESTVQPTTDLRSSFLNAQSAVNRGVELELRKGLGTIHHTLRDWNLQGNFTFVDSTVTIRPEDQGILTSLSRPLAGQSRYIFNVITEWTKPKLRSQARFYVNSVSRRLSDVGSIGLPDIYQERNLFLDFVYQYSLVESGKATIRFNAENLGDNKYRWTQAGLPTRQYQTGRTYTVGLTYSIF
ncbi:TonB-dependent receptor domain-containing protein [uncultured Paludibaculum sp.]|uniref:TonB-dependent receptor n=1 Tax=uncultured Paludibaculum sp. TaxID=1765020 RepID=UPI002AAC35DB|nr:TonB-dependent receptor [uncultured Paludibaculum sp.]